MRAEAGEGLDRGILISIDIDRELKPPLRFRNIHTESLVDFDGTKPSSSFEKIVSDLATILGIPEPSDKPAAKIMERPEIDAMVEVPAGEFIYQDGKTIIERPYMIDVYPVTNQQYKKFIEADGYKNADYWSKEGQEWPKKEEVSEPQYWTDESFNQPDLPVVGVTYYEVEAYAKWTDKRLPTEKERERAARGIDGREYPWGNEFDQPYPMPINSG